MMQVKNEGIEILRVLCGSRAYGLNDEQSDYDYHHVFVLPTSKLLQIGPKVNEKAWNEGEEEDNTGWELRHFLEMATQCNPTVLETFVAPIINWGDAAYNEYGAPLRALLPHVLNRKRIYDAFRGYAKNQRTKMFEPTGPGSTKSEAWFRRRRKAAIAYLRSLYHGIQLLESGTYDPQIPDGRFRNFLMQLRSPEWVGSEVRLHDVIRWAEELEEQIESTYALSHVPLEPDMDRVNAYLLRVRQELWA